MCKRLRDCAIPECVRTVIPFQYLLRSNISGMSSSLGNVNAKDTRHTVHTVQVCGRTAESSVSKEDADIQVRSVKVCV